MWCRTPKFSNIYRKTAMLESLFYKVAGLKAYIFIKKRLQHRCFAVNIAKFLRTPVLKNVCKRLLLILNWWSRHQSRNQNLDRLFYNVCKNCFFFFQKHDIQHTLYYFHTTLQWFCPINTVTTSWAEQRLSPWERIYIRKRAGNYVFKIWMTFILPYLILKIWPILKIAMKLFKLISN